MVTSVMAGRSSNSSTDALAERRIPFLFVTGDDAPRREASNMLLELTTPSRSS